MTTFFKPGNFEWKNLTFWVCLAFNKSYFCLSLRLITWFMSQQPKTNTDVEHQTYHLPNSLFWAVFNLWQGPRIQVTAITALFPCLINKKNVTFVKPKSKLLVLLSNCWASAQKKSTRNLREGVTALIKDQPILFIDKVELQAISSITIFWGLSSLVSKVSQSPATKRLSSAHPLFENSDCPLGLTWFQSDRLLQPPF